MNIVQNNQLTFHNTTFAHMEMGGQIWLTASEIGQALEYADDKAIHRLYRKHADEFTNNMTGVVKVTTPGGMQDVRMFSLRGSHLIGMFARTDVAKEFRRWVLDILDREVAHSPIAKQFTDDELYDLACLWSVSQIIRSDAKIVKAAMELVDSPIAKKISKNDADIEYFSNKARNVLLRESQHIAKMANPGLGWKTELNRLNGKGELH